jgi:hypothetical protein
MGFGHTYEIRWFFDGSVPAAVRTWWTDLPSDVVDAAERTNVYFVVASRSDFGMKPRGGRLELKGCERSEPPLMLPGGCEGRLEWWLKQKWKLSAPVCAHNDFTVRGERLRVTKSRSRHMYDSDTQGCPDFLVVQPPANGRLSLVAELTTITSASTPDSRGYAPARPGWTLAVETQGDRYSGDQLRSALVLGAEWLLGADPGPPLSADNSYGYPAFTLRDNEHPEIPVSISGTDAEQESAQ